ncbi:MAG: preprotein translocase subunit SecA [Candidatus Eisenbacteria bacterium]|uniref:Protein translocase subunit SecA n=1 Tax=Eiseniibacteriota bacterium TaxID=2212470 RepID=A0A9D6QK01_UNCEI|nr:preprotein translocase subunit SecA [Candidatus Eisenbacteria bacterium]MBI3539691.1 preprotein translocase subunit SecA [Candidatus Eisenbacteria bacterium]
MLEKLLKGVFGSKHDRDVRRAAPLVDEINRIVAGYRDLDDEALRGKTAEFRARLDAAREGLTEAPEIKPAEAEALTDLLPEAFAAVKEACRRLCGRTWDVVGIPVTWDMVPYDVQLIGGIMLHEGRIAEMATGEGKTLVATMPIYLNALTGRGVHLVTVNDYLARRDSEWMGEIYKFLGLTVGCIQNQMDPSTRRVQYECDITYGTNNEFGFDYLRDNMAVYPEHRVQRGFAYAIVDEVDSVLVDEARTPLIISGAVEHSDQAFDELKPLVERLVRAQQALANQHLDQAQQLIEDPDKAYEVGTKLLQVQRAAPKHKRFTRLLSEQPGLKKQITTVELDYLRDKRMHEIDEDLYFAIDEKARNVDLLEKGREFMSPSDPERFVVPDLTGQLSELEGREDLTQADRVTQRDEIYRAYAAKNEKIHNIQALLKAYALFEKDVEYVVQDGKVLIVDEFTGRLMPGRRYSEGLHQAIEAKEGVRVEGETQTLATITLQNFFRMYDKLAGMTGTAETEATEFWEIYKLDVSVIPTHKPCVREDAEDVVFRTKREKFKAVVDEIVACHEKGQPVLVGTINVEVSELLSRMLKMRGIVHEVLNAKQHQREAEIVARAGQRAAVTIATNMAGRGTDIKLGPGVTELGGLHILGTERHESRRIDRQLRGRAGRQGDPGSSRFSLSLEDDLMRLFGSERISSLMQRMGVQEGEVIEHPLVTGAIGRAQKRVEAHNFDIRKHLLEYDNVMNRQRTVVYDLRNEALLSQDMSASVLEAITAVARTRADKATGDGKVHRDEWDLKLLADDLSFLLRTPLAAADLEARDHEALLERVGEIAENAYRAREAELTAPTLREVERRLFLDVLDAHWRDHLYELDHLKSGIGLRAYGQRDPLVEYKREAYGLFETLLDEVNEDFVGALFRVQIVDERPPVAARQKPRQIVEQHAAAEVFGGVAAPAEAGPPARGAQGRTPAPAPQPAAAPVTLRAGRNDPCPCGSGKKYKKCHMLIDQGVGTGA